MGMQIAAAGDIRHFNQLIDRAVDDRRRLYASKNNSSNAGSAGSSAGISDAFRALGGQRGGNSGWFNDHSIRIGTGSTTNVHHHHHHGSDTRTREEREEEERRNNEMQNRVMWGALGAVIFLAGSFFAGSSWSQYQLVNADYKMAKEATDNLRHSENPAYAQAQILSQRKVMPILEMERNHAFYHLASRVSIVACGLLMFTAAIIASKALLAAAGIGALLTAGYMLFSINGHNHLVRQTKDISDRANRALEDLRTQMGPSRDATPRWDEAPPPPYATNRSNAGQFMQFLYPRAD